MFKFEIRNIIVDEKILGEVHFGIGQQYWGWYC